MWIKIDGKLINLDKYSQIFHTLGDEGEDNDEVLGLSSSNNQEESATLYMGTKEKCEEVMKNLTDTLYIQELGGCKCAECGKATMDYSFTENDQGMMEKVSICMECHQALSIQQKLIKPKILRAKVN